MQTMLKIKASSSFQLIIFLFVILCTITVSCTSTNNSVEEINDEEIEFTNTTPAETNAETEENLTVPTEESIEPPVDMRTFTTEYYNFALDIPSDWIDAQGTDDRCKMTQTCFVSNNDQILVINESDGGDVGKEGMMTTSEYVDAIMQTFGDDAPDYEFLSRETLESKSGQNSEIINYTIYDGAVKAKMLWFAKDGKVINVYFMGFEDSFHEIDAVSDWSFKSLQKNEE